MVRVLVFGFFFLMTIIGVRESGAGSLYPVPLGLHPQLSWELLWVNDEGSHQPGELRPLLLRQDPDSSCTPRMLFPPLPVSGLISDSKSHFPFSVHGRNLVSNRDGTSWLEWDFKGACGPPHTKRPSQLKVQRWREGLKWT